MPVRVLFISTHTICHFYIFLLNINFSTYPFGSLFERGRHLSHSFEHIPYTSRQLLPLVGLPILWGASPHPGGPPTHWWASPHTGGPPHTLVGLPHPGGPPHTLVGLPHPGGPPHTLVGLPTLASLISPRIRPPHTL